MFIGVLFNLKSFVSIKEIIFFWMFFVKARLAEEIVFAIVTLDICNLLFANAAINDQESFSAADLTQPILQNVPLQIMECFSE